MPLTASSLMQSSSVYSRQAINELLEGLDKDIRGFARRKAPHNVVSSKIFNIEVDELAQNMRIKLWLALQRGNIINPKAYAKCIAHTESVDIIRKCKKNFPLPIDDYRDLDQIEIIAASDQGMQDPAVAYEQKERVVACIEMIVKGVLLLPPRQQYGVLCDLKNCAADIPLLMDVLLKYGLDIAAVHWPENKDELGRLRASRSIARRKLRDYLERENIARSSFIRFERRR